MLGRRVYDAVGLRGNVTERYQNVFFVRGEYYKTDL